MTKSTQKTTKQTQHSHDDQVKELAQEVAEYDDVEIVAEVDIDNQAVSDVLIIRDTDTKADQADHTDDASKADDETVVDGVKQKAQEAKEDFENKAQDLQDKATEKLEVAKEATQDKVEKTQSLVEDIKDKAQSLQEDAADTVEALKQAASDKVETTKAEAQSLKDDATQTFESAKQAVEGKVEAIKEQVLDQVDSLKDDTDQDNTDQDQEKQTLKDKAVQAATAAKRKVEDVVDDVKHTTESFKNTASGKIDEIKQAAVDKTEEVKSQLSQKADALKSSGEELKQTAQTAANDAITEAQAAVVSGSVAAADSAQSTAQSAKDKLNQLFEQGKSALDEKVQELGEKFGATEKINAVSENVDLATQVIKEEAQALQTNAQESLQAAKAAGEEYDATHEDKGLTTKLGKVGAYLSGMYGISQNKNKHYQGVDLYRESFDKDAFHAQSSFFAGQIFGAKAVAAKNVAAKVVPQSKFEAIGESLYNKVAEWSNAWAIKDLKNDPRFDLINTMNTQERHAFAEDVANQNRALATLGGVAGLAGLKGVLADAAWLLMVSLRTVYQVAAIYDQPLTGKEGTKKAYGVLSGANLEKLQEKQVILTALALGSSMLANAQQTGIKAQLDSLSARYRESQPYAKQFLDLDKFVNLDNLNPNWLHKILPISAVAVGAHYNNELIDEVIGTAMATFSDDFEQSHQLISNSSENTENQESTAEA
ncbi:ecsC family protein [Moraxella catarrhalis]|uniref:EcsC family protein n=1 Tax=Moraxella catarrhalis TaxID=480 RepID=UPI0004E82BA7|nr:EcsC family protein [Moraxella catarrhalis]AIK01519.1 ecsC family protein [Moraxella catarrhalis]